jgi:hypothetical protein
MVNRVYVYLSAESGVVPHGTAIVIMWEKAKNSIKYAFCLLPSAFCLLPSAFCLPA